jgi:hypothetical protein
VYEPGAPGPAPPPRDAPGGEIDPERIDLAMKIFNLARAGDTAAVAAYVDAGVPVNLTNDSGDTLVMLAASTHDQSQQTTVGAVHANSCKDGYRSLIIGVTSAAAFRVTQPR